ncbi:hypothetical protein Clacol_003782 [Clathrus columnatus]|uniref:Fe2OG dioxygenase domain-containing protein n=1 Tax=Clathrus columnatus TaxID=1419009 RepID=A0AAV5A8J0_9AGAM|nr:hypothetical protein Clacol_003782 [Clathrus columnatus]
MQQKIQLSPEGAVVIPYNRLVANPDSLQEAIAKGFGSDPSCLGLIIISDLPEDFKWLRERLMLLGDEFASLPESIREKYADERRNNERQTRSICIFLANPCPRIDIFVDFLKGSFYANPILDEANVGLDQIIEFPEYYSRNIWPVEPDVWDFEEAFKGLGRFVFRVGRELANACQSFAASHLVDQAIPLADLISPNTTKARLLHYFPPPLEKLPKEDEPFDSWCGFHLDHSLLTGLCSAMYLYHGENGTRKICSAPSPQSGLYIKTRGGDLIKVSIPPNCLAFQTGEALELATNGKLRATPHCVRVGGGPHAEQISRETFAVFMQPDSDVQIGPSDTFGSFSKRVLSEHYNIPS